MGAAALNAISIFATLSAIIAGAVVGVAVVLSRYVMQEATPETLALLRYSIGVLFMLPVMLFSFKGWFKSRDILPIALLGIAQFAVLILLLNHSLNYITSARAALIFSTLPLQTMIIAACLGRERLVPQKTIGICLTLIGLAVAEWPNLTAGGDNNSNWIGISFAAASAFCGATCSIFYKPYLSRYPTTTISTFAMSASALFLLVYTVPTDAFWQISAYSDHIWVAIIAVGFSSAIGYFTWLWALKHLAATTVTMFLCFGPITATLLGTFVLGEPLTLIFVGGLCIVICGILTALSARNIKSTTAVEPPIA